jgi:anti-anti-sigma regulatory factor
LYFPHKITVVDNFSSTLNTREAATELVNLVSDFNSTEIELDFSGVEFISRSFADQFHKDLEQLRSKKKNDIQILNASEPVIRMMQAVANTQHKTEREYVSLPALRFTDRKLLRDYLLSL